MSTLNFVEVSSSFTTLLMNSVSRFLQPFTSAQAAAKLPEMSRFNACEKWFCLFLQRTGPLPTASQRAFSLSLTLVSFAVHWS